jgi:hypothetical protein
MSNELFIGMIIGIILGNLSAYIGFLIGKHKEKNE